MRVRAPNDRPRIMLRPGERMMGKSRLEAFSDGVIAIIITIMVLDLKVPAGAGVGDIAQVLPVFLNYVLSFITVAIYWSDHHHVLHATRRVTGGVLWANTHLLFWLSLFPFVTGWMGEHHTAPLPAAVYAFVALMAGASYWFLERVIVAADGPDSTLGQAIGSERKGKISVVIYATGVPLAFVSATLTQLLCGVVALMWLTPDRRIERSIAAQPQKE